MVSIMGDKRILFGTDGVRDVANKGSMTPEMALRLGRAFVLFMAERGKPRPRVVLGRDTRRSGLMLEGALSAGMTSAGADVLFLGVIPTPGLSWAVQHLAADGGAMISASHNPAEYNGIKFLDRDGRKLSDGSELRIEDLLGDDLTDDWRPTGASVGEIRHMPHLVQGYAERLASILERSDGIMDDVVFDCAHGAAGIVMPTLVERVGARWQVVAASSDGMDINEGAGVMHMEHLTACVVDLGCRLGFAFDGDADRVLVSDSKGRVIDGDVILWVLARWLAPQGLLGGGVAVTVMSNMALEGHLEKEGIRVFRCPVGDRYVLEAMGSSGARLGGEQSGHVIVDAFATTGDGPCTAMLFMNALRALGEDADTLVDRFGRYPQKLSNLTLEPRALPDMDRVDEIVAEAQARIGKMGRAFVRPSGTEPLLRILVEATEIGLVEELSQELMERLAALCRQ